MIEGNLPSLHPDEKIVASINDHWVISIKPFLFYILGWMLALLFFWLSQEVIREVSAASTIVSAILIFMTLAMIVLIHHGLFLFLFSWEVSSWIITTSRIADFEFLPFIKHNTDFIQIDAIQSIKKRKDNILKNFFNYGDVEIYLHGSKDPLVLKNIPKPSQVVNVLEIIRSSTHPSQIKMEELKKYF